MAENESSAVRTDSPPAMLRRHWPLVVVLVAYAILALGYNLATPVGEAADEPTHVEFVRHVLATHRLPVLRPEPGSGLPQAKHPPLYYVAGAALSFWADYDTLRFVKNPHFRFNIEDPPAPNLWVHSVEERFPGPEGFLAVRIMRLLSLLSGAVVVWATYQLGRTVWPGAPYVAWGAAAVVAFVPQFTFLSGSFNNDAMANAWAALALLGSVRLALGYATRRDFLLLGTVLGLGLLTKLTTIPALGVAGLGLLVYALRNHAWRRLPRALVEIGLPTLLIAGWWFARNMRLYGYDDPLGWRQWSGRIPQMHRVVPLSEELGAYFWVQLTTFWGRFGWSTVLMPDSVYRMLLSVTVLAAFGLVLLVRRRSSLPSETHLGMAFVASSVLLMYVSVFWLALSLNMVVAHGRLLDIAIAGLGVLFITGLTQLSPGAARPWAAGAVSLGMFVLSAAALVFVVVPTFRLPEPLAPEAVAAISHPLAVDFDHRFRLFGYDISADRIAAGETLTITLFWGAVPGGTLLQQPPAAQPEGHVVFVHAVDAAGEVVGRVDAVPFGGVLPTVGWPPGHVFRVEYVVPVSADAVTGRAVLLIGLYRAGGSRTRLPATRAGDALGDAYRLEPLVIRPAEPVVVKLEPERRLGDTFGEAGPDGEVDATGLIHLLGYGVSVDGGGWVLVTLYWQADSVPATDLTVFVHLVGPDGGALVATGDGPPQSGRYPTLLWEPGEIVVDEHELEVPAGLPHGQYALRVGLYDPGTAARLPAWDGGGLRWPDDAVDLTEIAW